MNTDTADATLAAYRTTHRIAPMIRDGQDICAVDGIRVLPVKGGRLRHHPDDIVKLLDASYGGAWPRGTTFRDEAEQLVAQDIAREDIFEEGRITVEWHGHAVDVDVAP